MEDHVKKTFKVFFEYGDLGIYNSIPGIKKAMKSELMRVYNIYANKFNSGICDELNRQFKSLYPNYFEENSDKEWYDLVQYNQFMADGENALICDELNSKKESPILDFFVDSNELVFTGYIRGDKKATISFYLKEV